MQDEYLVSSRGWENERASMSERIQQLEQDDAAPDSDEEDS